MCYTAKMEHYRKKSYAVIFALQRFEHYVMRAKILLYTAHNQWKYLTASAPNNSKLTRWALALQQFGIEVESPTKIVMQSQTALILNYNAVMLVQMLKVMDLCHGFKTAKFWFIQFA